MSADSGLQIHAIPAKQARGQSGFLTGLIFYDIFATKVW